MGSSSHIFHGSFHPTDSARNWLHTYYTTSVCSHAVKTISKCLHPTVFTVLYLSLQEVMLGGKGNKKYFCEAL